MRIETLSEDSFAAFGVPIHHPGGPGRHPLPSVLASSHPAPRPAVWVNALQPSAWPLRIETLERHPHGAQSFIPMGSGTLLAVVCGHGPDGQPDPCLLRGFVCPPGTGLSYHPGVWHHGLCALGQPMNVVVVMAAHGLADETVWSTLSIPIVVEETDLP